MARTPLISGNWKMHLNHFEALKLVQELSYQVTTDDVEVVDISLHPPFTDLRTVQTVLEADRLPFHLGAQHCHFEDKGAFTGEVAPSMLAKMNVSYVIVGHSERREVFGETDEMVNAKVKAILAQDMVPILCVGETLEEREAGDAESKVAAQVKAGLADVSAENVAALGIAYEPIWAIGTGKTAEVADIAEMHAEIRALLIELYGEEYGAEIRILYGGSVKPENAAEILGTAEVGGALVGGASLTADSFMGIALAAGETDEA